MPWVESPNTLTALADSTGIAHKHKFTTQTYQLELSRDVGLTECHPGKGVMHGWTCSTNAPADTHTSGKVATPSLLLDSTLAERSCRCRHTRGIAIAVHQR